MSRRSNVSMKLEDDEEEEDQDQVMDSEDLNKSSEGRISENSINESNSASKNQIPYITQTK